MKRDASTVASGTTLKFDVCLVGAGPAGLAIAEVLAADGWKVGLLEAGGEKPEPEVQKSAEAVRRGLPYFRLDRARTRAIGGSSWMWLDEGARWPLDGGLRSRPLDRIDFEERPHVPFSGWPITYEDLEPWFRKAEERMGLDSLAYGGAADGELPFDRSVVETCVSQFAERDVFRRDTAALLARENVDVLLHAAVIGVELNAEGTAATRLRVASASGWFQVEARQFVLAGGGIENARILLASEAGRPGGPANPFDQLGRYFMEHVHVDSGFFVPAPGARVEDLLALYRRHMAGEHKQIRTLRLTGEAQQREGLLNTVTEFLPRRKLFTSAGVRSFAELAWGIDARSAPEHVVRHFLNIAAQPHRVAAAAWLKKRRVHEEQPSGATLVMTAEQAPNPASRITLGRRVDRFGVPVARLEWRLTPLDEHSIRRTQDILDAQFRAAGLGQIELKWGETHPNPRIHGCWHHIGTTRMSSDPRTGVVDGDCFLHGLSNLSFAGSSVMPTAGAVTVTLSITALALRLAGELGRRLG
ncbi:MAG: GMC family oxidoreductase [Dehalococcoidia bacterium]|uniref:GMC family oxidoreductase n=1 Tax=Candidatus Amarobacter glycogenicus TaxID=3140699 RepID=UPI003137599A|nr:GMC family oxidoreductase [Dehalococcoidia bacterium]